MFLFKKVLCFCIFLRIVELYGSHTCSSSSSSNIGSSCNSCSGSRGGGGRGNCSDNTSNCDSSSRNLTRTGKYKLGARAGLRIGKFNLETRAGKCKLGARAVKQKFGAKTGPLGKGQGQGSSKSPGAGKYKNPIINKKISMDVMILLGISVFWQALFTFKVLLSLKVILVKPFAFNLPYEYNWRNI